MQKLRIMSDLHLEFGALLVPELPEDNDTILILPGDIHVGHNATAFIAEMLVRFKEVIYVLGNHEFYHNDMEKVREFWQEQAGLYHNLHVLDPGVYELDDLRIIGATLWTDAIDPEVELMLSDYACIQRDDHVLTVQDTYNLNLDDVYFIQNELKQPFEGTTIVVTHHAPVEACIVPKYAGDRMNQCFHNRLDWMLFEYDIKYWFHGHMHDTIMIEHHDTKIICNPRGYKGHSLNWGFRDDLVVNL